MQECSWIIFKICRLFLFWLFINILKIHNRHKICLKKHFPWWHIWYTLKITVNNHWFTYHRVTRKFLFFFIDNIIPWQIAKLRYADMQHNGQFFISRIEIHRTSVNDFDDDRTWKMRRIYNQRWHATCKIWRAMFHPCIIVYVILVCTIT